MMLIGIDFGTTGARRYRKRHRESIAVVISAPAAVSIIYRLGDCGFLKPPFTTLRVSQGIPKALTTSQNGTLN